MKTKVFLLSLFLIGFSFSLSAQRTATPKVTKRQVTQQKRIRSGVKDGSLSKREAVGLQRQQRRVNRTKRAAKSDGVVTGRERAAIHTRQNRASRNIRRQKKDGNNRRGRN